MKKEKQKQKLESTGSQSESEKATESEKSTGQNVQFEKLTYNAILEEAKRVASKTVQIYVVNLCEALRRERPDYTYIQIKDQVYSDLKPLWSAATISKYWPNWLKNQGRSDYFKGINEAAKERKQVEKLVRTFVPPTAYEEYDDDIHGIGQPLDAYAQMNRGLHQFWKAMTNGEKDRPPLPTQNLNEFIEPNREFRRKVISELHDVQLGISYHGLIATQELIKDTVSIYSDTIKKYSSSKSSSGGTTTGTRGYESQR